MKSIIYGRAVRSSTTDVSLYIHSTSEKESLQLKLSQLIPFLNVLEEIIQL